METHSHSIRVLVRPPPAPSLPLPPQPPPPPPPDPYPPPKNGVVVVGFIGKRHHDVAHLINKIMDSNVFGSGNLDTPFRFEPDKINPEMSKWFESRKLSFYHDEDQGILYLQFSSVRCPVTEEGSSETRFRFGSVFEDQEFGDLQGLVFMFSVTPSFPILLAADPIIQFELSCLPPSVPDRETKLQFSLGCPVILPPESFLSLKLPFVYGVELEDGSLHSLKPFENQPQLTAYIMKGTTLRVLSNKSNLDPASVT